MYPMGYIHKEIKREPEISVWALKHRSILKVLEVDVEGEGRIQKQRIIAENKPCADGFKINKRYCKAASLIPDLFPFSSLTRFSGTQPSLEGFPRMTG